MNCLMEAVVGDEVQRYMGSVMAKRAGCSLFCHNTETYSTHRTTASSAMPPDLAGHKGLSASSLGLGLAVWEKVSTGD